MPEMESLLYYLQLKLQYYMNTELQVDTGKHNILQGEFYNKCAVIVHFELQNWGKKVKSHLFACRPTCEIQKD